MIQAIIKKSRNSWKAFPSLFVLSALACLVACFGVNVPKGRDAAAQWATEKRGMGTGMVYWDEKDEESSESKSKGKAMRRYGLCSAQLAIWHGALSLFRLPFKLQHPSSYLLLLSSSNIPPLSLSNRSQAFHHFRSFIKLTYIGEHRTSVRQ